MQLPTPTTTPTGPAPIQAQAPAVLPAPQGGTALPRKKAEFDPAALLGPAAWLALALLATALVLVVVDRWRKRQSRGGESMFGSLSDYRQMYEDGELTEAEYNKLRSKLAPKIKAELKVAPPAPAAPPAPLPPLSPPPPDSPPISS